MRPRAVLGDIVGVSLSLFDRPTITAGYRMRPYQAAAIAAVDEVHREHRGALVVHATGCGKTVLFCEEARKHGSALVLVHRDSLARQAAAKLEAATGTTVGIEKAERTAWEGTRFVVGSVQSLRGARLGLFAARFSGQFRIIITDEAHRSVAAGYRKIYEAFPDAKLLGMTATADRLDEVALGAVYDQVAHEYGIIPATADGWLTPIEYRPIRAGIDLGKIGKRGGDLDQDALDDAIAQEAAKIAASIIEHAGDKRLIIFTPGVKAAHVTSEALNRLRDGCAAAVDGTTPLEERRGIEARHQAGELRYLLNCDTHTEGYDDPTLDGIMDCAKTMSRLKVMQRIGRGTRLGDDAIGELPTPDERRAAIAASRKPLALWYDLVCNAGRWDNVLVGPLDLLAGKLPDEVRARAKKILETEGGEVDKAISAAEQQIDAERRAAIAARMAARVKAAMGKPRSIWDIAGVRPLSDEFARVSPMHRPTPNQIGSLRKRAIPYLPNCTRGQAGKLIAEDKRRQKEGICRLAGVAWLANYGVDASALPSSMAREVRDAIVANGRQPLPAAQLAAMLQRHPGEEF